MSRSERLLAHTVGTDHLAWFAYRKLLDRLCVCGHSEYDHCGIREPGCSYMGMCRCLKWVLAPAAPLSAA